jgi:outer membrane beta-barrel protein
MERWLRILILSGVCAATSGCASLNLPSFQLPFMQDKVAAPETVPVEEEETAGPVEASDANGESPSVVEPVVSRRPVRQVKIDAEDFEIGPYMGVMALEEFGMHPSYGVRMSYHVSEDLFAEVDVGRSKGGLSSYERLTGTNFFPDSGRQITYYDLGAYYNLLPGEIFLGRGRAFNSSLYVGGSVGAMRFAGDNRFTAALGGGYRVMVNNWLSLRVDLRDRLMRSPLPGLDRASHNLESYLGFTVFF